MGGRRRLLLSLVLAPIVGGLFGAVLSSVVSVFQMGHFQIATSLLVSTTASSFLKITLVVAVITCTIGVLMHIWMRHLRLNESWVYAFAEALGGGWIVVLTGALTAGTGPDMIDVISDTGGYLPFAVAIGCVTAVTAWLIRRPDRDVREGDRAPPGAHGDERSDAGA